MDTTLSDPMVDRRLDGRYVIRHRIARGGMATVYAATDTRLDRRVAVKVMHPGYADDPAFVARFTREARAAAALNHPDVVSVYDQGTDDGHPFLVMEFVPGGTLLDVLHERGRLSPAEALAVMDHVLAALGAAHAAGLVHRDVKPANVLITPDGRVKVVDFGLARAAAGSTITAGDATVLGTAAYLAPEQMSGGSSDARTDVYAAGIMLFELLTGAPPFGGDSPAAIANRHVNEDVPEPSSVVPGIPPELDALVLAATARDPFDRPGDARALHTSLVAVRDRLGLHAAVPTPRTDTTAAADVGGGDTLVVQRPDDPTVTVGPPMSPPPTGTTRRRRRRWPYAVALVVVAALLAAFGGWYLAAGRYFKTPNVIGATKPAAENTLRHKGLSVHWAPSVYNDTIGAGLVAAESPAPGDHVRHGASVTLALSKGHDRVPDIRGLTVEQATPLLADRQLRVGARSSTYSDKPKGQIVSTSPRPGAVIKPGSPVDIVVSQGQAPIKVPDVTKKKADQATSILQALGLTVVQTAAFSDTVPKDVVISTNPPGGATAHKGDTVTLVVSKGPHLYPVPDVVGMKIGAAIKAIEQAGFTAAPNQVFPAGPGKVIRETPTGNQPKGTRIELDYY